MQRSSLRRRRDPGPGLVDRCISAFVAVLYFAPLLALLWFAANVTLNMHGPAGDYLDTRYLVAAIAASAVLGFVAPRVTPAVFGWVGRMLWQMARFWVP